MDGWILEDPRGSWRIREIGGDAIRIFVTMQMWDRSSRKVILSPDIPYDGKEPSALVVALARAYARQKDG